MNPKEQHDLLLTGVLLQCHSWREQRLLARPLDTAKDLAITHLRMILRATMLVTKRRLPSSHQTQRLKSPRPTLIVKDPPRSLAAQNILTRLPAPQQQLSIPSGVNL